ncbi:hypothetical protein GXP67_02825 [Rhodocytophaga rosea]|uniref:Uncharacterized protein n=1 Tax=Rhodocytophaga rosea TaxID=2704465 RepID=A0A6C0GCU7_9BACT|nr:hypothetical protein [Rhodocytophaga rosea]QHT65674.1 hypothetical protein GXP67_02825 [Rhodocytophaga rosea]
MKQAKKSPQAPDAMEAKNESVAAIRQDKQLKHKVTNFRTSNIVMPVLFHIRHNKRDKTKKVLFIAVSQ